MFKVKLDVKARLCLVALLENEESSFARLKLIRDFRSGLSLSENEQKLIGFKEEITPDGRAFSGWAYPEKDPLKEFEIGEILQEIISKNLKELDSNGKLKNEHYSLYEAFLPVLEK